MMLDPNSFKQTNQYQIFGKNTDSFALDLKSQASSVIAYFSNHSLPVFPLQQEWEDKVKVQMF